MKKKKKRSIKKVPLPFYKSMLFWTIISIVVVTILGIANLLKKQNVTTYENSEIVKDSANVSKLNIEGDYISGNKIQNIENTYSKSKSSTATKENDNKEICEELKIKHQKLSNDLKDIKDETAKSIINEELKKLEEEIESKCNQ